MKVLVNVVKLIKIKALSFNTFSFYRGNAHNKLFQFVRFAHPLRLTKGGISKNRLDITRSAHKRICSTQTTIPVKL